MNEPAESDQLDVAKFPIGTWWRKITAVLSLSTVVIISGVLFAAAIGVLTLLILFIIERALV